MKNTRWAALAAVPALLAGALFAASPRPAAAAQHAASPSISPSQSCVRTAVPLYGPGMWAPTVGVAPEAWLGIANFGANPENSFHGGPGTAYNNDDDVSIQSSEGEGTPVIGYIGTNGGTGATGFTEADIEAQMTDWHSWYGVYKFFLAQVPTATTYQPFYTALRNWAHANIGKQSRLWLDMGAYPASSSWMNDAAVIMDWEAGTDPATPPGWVSSYSTDRFAMFVNQVPYTTSAIDAAVNAIQAAHAGWGFVTSDPTYQTLPTWDYWEDFANYAFDTCYRPRHR
jgi:Spherulation-specific family 4